MAYPVVGKKFDYCACGKRKRKNSWQCFYCYCRVKKNHMVSREDIVELHLTGYSQSDIARKLGVSPSRIVRLLRPCRAWCDKIFGVRVAPAARGSRFSKAK